MSKTILEIEDLYASVGDKEIIKGFNLVIKEGETHAIMGPNGAGKSTLSHVLTGKKGYNITGGQILFKGKDITQMSIDERSKEGMFLCMQYPTEIPGVQITSFLKHAINEHRQYKGLPQLDTMEFIKEVKKQALDLGLGTDMVKRFVNCGFSGGESKRLEILQMSILKPDLAILDEPDSGLDVDALKIVGDGVNKLKTEHNARLIITHYQKFLGYVVPDFVHVFAQGKIIKSGGKDLALEVDREGYGQFIAN